ncbi:MAG: hypothetical protein KatS3mg057_1345 [Herpetosiphonaceae bacterium]|nr:MAG: hypothetical protein KatS3mg057_1345 [Herpetosiphonaceae bacterium]
MLTKTNGRRSIRVLVSALLVTLLLAALAACGAGSTAVDPETRVKNFFKDFESAINDPNIAQEATQEKWAETLSSYAVPAQRAEVKGEMKEALAGVGDIGTQIGALTGQENLKITFKIENLQTKKQSEESNIAKVEITSGQLRMETEGADLPPELQAVFGEPIPLSEVTEGSNVVTLEKVDGNWYIRNEQ